MSLNKKVLSIAVFGVLASGSAFGADLSAPNGAVPAYFAKEIIAGPGADATQIGTSNAGATLDWDINYNFSAGEVRYARVQCSDNIEFASTSTIEVNGTTPAGGVVGSINGLGDNVLTFSITAADGAPVVAADTFSVVGDHSITGTDQNVNCSVGLYDQPSQAQAGGSVGLIQNTSFSGAYLAFVPSYELVLTQPTTHVANVEAVPTFSQFVIDTNTGTDIARLGNNALSLRLRDPDGSGGQNATFNVDGNQFTSLAQLLGSDTELMVEGDFSIAASAGSTPFDAAARSRVALADANVGSGANGLTGSRATFENVNTGFIDHHVQLVSRTAGSPSGIAIPAAEYVANLDAVSAAPNVYSVNDITEVKVGEIVRNGTELQAPLVQRPNGWISRVVLTNTGSLDRSYDINVQGEAGNNIGTGTLTGTVGANSTVVLDVTDILTSFSGSARATLNVTVAGPNNQIQGLYQIVNADSGSISNETMVRPGAN